MFTPIAGTVAAVFTDDQLLQQVAARDERAFAQLYERHISSAYAVARGVCRESADDAIQEAFLALWRDAAAFSPRPGGAAGWLHTIVRNRSVDLARKTAVRNRRTVLDECAVLAAICERPGPHDSVARQEQAERLRTAVDALPAPQRDVLRLAYLEAECTQAQIAGRLAVALGTVKSRTRLALSRLADDPALAH